MTSVTIRGLLANKLRLALTAVAIVLSVAFVAGTFVFTDTIEARFEALFDDVYAGVDVTVRPPADDLARPGSFDESIVAEVAAAEGVKVAEAGIGGIARIVGPGDEILGTMGAPTLGFAWGEEPALNPLRIEAGNGRGPVRAGEVVIDAATADDAGIAVGDRVRIETAHPAEEFTVVGIANFGTEDNLAGATLAAFEKREAQRLLDLEGRVSYVDVVGEEGVERDALAAQLAAQFGPEVEVVTGDEQRDQEVETLASELEFLGILLLSFAAVAVLVGGFIIQNTFRITVAQRARQIALLRAVGATRLQVTQMVITEAAIVGTVSSGVGLGAGVALAALLKAGMSAIGIDVPDGPLTVAPRTVVVALTVGIVATVISALLPAHRASTVAPVEALRQSQAEPRRSLRRRTVAGTALLAVGSALVTGGLATEAGIGLVAAGAVVGFLGVSVVSPLLVSRLAPLVRRLVPGISGKLATSNLARQPRRAAATASALMVGVALVAFVSVVAASVQASVESSVGGSLRGDVYVSSGALDGSVPAEAYAALADLDELAVLSPLTRVPAKVDGRETTITGVDTATIGQVYRPATEVDLNGLDGLLAAESTGLSAGDSVEIEYADGRKVATQVVGTMSDSTFGAYLIPASELEGAEIATVIATRAGGVDTREATTAAESALVDYPSLDIATSAELVDSARAGIDQMVALFTGLLLLAIVIAVLGITNTMALAVAERTREIGLLRAVGLARRQLRATFHREAVLMSLYGALLGVAAGAVLGWAVVASLADDGLGTFSLPLTSSVVWLAVAAVAGLVAAVGPARRAARLDVLTAIRAE